MSTTGIYKTGTILATDHAHLMHHKSKEEKGKREEQYQPQKILCTQQVIILCVRPHFNDIHVDWNKTPTISAT